MSYMINPEVTSWSDGIVTYLNKEHQHDLYDYIDIEASSTNMEGTRNGAYALINQTYYNNSNQYITHWCSQNKSHSYFIVIFPKFFVSPTFYSFETRDFDDIYNIYPLSWYIQGSVDKIKWVNISEEYGEHALQQNEKITLSFQKHGTFKYIKFIQIESSSSDFFCLYRFELFGSLIYSVPTFCSCSKFKFSSYLFLVAIFL